MRSDERQRHGEQAGIEVLQRVSVVTDESDDVDAHSGGTPG